jgi:ubiquinone/menaquinone biosynthesis C-methylase UbiE/uncharacterized protein YbaR (Trm112 family)
MDQQLLDFIPKLQCPLTRSDLRVLEKPSLNRLYEKIKHGTLHHADGSPVKEPFSDALVSEAHQLVYPVIDGQIAVLMENMAILPEDLDQLPAKQQHFDREKQLVRDFYEDYGWHKADDSKYRDTADFEDHRPVAANYWSRCHLRVNRYLRSGKYILDVASGTIPNDEYFTYSQNYELRICMDFSLLALKEAAVRLQGKGIFIMGDMANLPVKSNCLHAVVSLHTVYHVPQKEQTLAVKESQRVLKAGGVSVIVYSWRNSPLMRFIMGKWRSFIRRLNRARGKPGKRKNKEGIPELHVCHQNYDWYERELGPDLKARLSVYSSISRSFSYTFIRKKFFGKQLASLIYWLENRMPETLGRYGQYPLFILEKQAETNKATEDDPQQKSTEPNTF